MSNDSLGRPLSDDGQWAWNGSQWVPAAGGPVTAPMATVPAEGDVADPETAELETAGVASPFASEMPVGPGQSSDVYRAPEQDAAPAQQKSRTPLFAAVAGAVVLVVVAVVLIIALSGSSGKALSGKYTCTVPGQTGSATVTFNPGGKYALSDGGIGGSYAKQSGKVTFTGGSLNAISGTFDSKKNVVKFSFHGFHLGCVHNK